VTLQAYVYNLFNNQIPMTEDVVWSNQQWAGYPADLFNQPQSNDNYGKVTARTDPRAFRAAVRVSF